MARRMTPTQHAVAMNARLERRPLTERQAAWAIAHVFPTQLLTSQRRGRTVAYCSDCGNEVHNLSLKVCPHCGRPFRGKMTKRERSRSAEKAYFCLMTTAGGLQALRFFIIARRFRQGRVTEYSAEEVQRHLFDAKGGRWYFARPVMSMSMYYDQWIHSRPITYRGRNPQVYGYRSKMRSSLYACATLVESVTPTLRRNGLRRSLDFTRYPVDAVQGLLTQPWMETLLKTGQKELLDFCIYKGKTLSAEVMASVRICNRNHYVIKDPSMWLDYLNHLTELGADTHNAHYVCPPDLIAAHDLWLRRYQRHRKLVWEREEAERARREIEAAQNYPERMGALLTLMLTGSDLSVRPLQNVEEFREEGTAMHHCVFQNRYYDPERHPDCLILSAKDAAGKRLATIEYNTARNTIVQCRAACNGVPERDAEIRALIMENVPKIQALLHKQTKDATAELTASKTEAAQAAAA